VPPFDVHTFAVVVSSKFTRIASAYECTYLIIVATGMDILSVFQ
jgi:hypothetical protein